MVGREGREGDNMKGVITLTVAVFALGGEFNTVCSLVGCLSCLTVEVLNSPPG